MDELIIRSIQGRTTDEEEQRLREWRNCDPANEHHYSALQKLWTLTGAAAPPTREDFPDVSELIARAGTEAPLQRHTAIAGAAPRQTTAVRSGVKSSSWLRRTAIGALAAGLVTLGMGVGTLLEQEEERTFLSRSEIVTGAGEMTTVTLGDGSTIRLGPRSHLRLAERGPRRTVWLEGRAFFAVKADSTRPFTVFTEHGEAEALGTRFEVQAEDEFRVLVVDGSVSVVAGGSEVRLSEGQMRRSIKGRQPSTETVEDVFAHMEWIGNSLVFQATPLGRAITEIERRHGVEIVLEDPSLADISVTATFTDRPIDEVVFVICEIVGAECTTDGGEYRIGQPARSNV